MDQEPTNEWDRKPEAEKEDWKKQEFHSRVVNVDEKTLGAIDYTYFKAVTTGVGVASIDPLAGMVSKCDFSGKGAILCWQSAARKNWLYPIEPEDGEDASQITFHATWGTPYESAHILDLLVPGKVWKTRSDLKGFMGIGAKAPTKVQLYKFAVYSKLSAACESELLAPSNSQLIAAKVFAGRRVQQYTHKLLKFTAEGRTLVSGADIHSLITALNTEIERILEIIKRRGKLLAIREVSWFDAKKIKLFSDGPIVHLQIEGSDRLLMS